MTKPRPKWQEIQYTKKGRPFIKYYKMRIHLDEVMRLPQPELIEELNFIVHGSITISNTAAICIQISDDGNHARTTMTTI